MAYISTRGGDPVSASRAILNGISENGGLYVPMSLPVFSQEQILSLAELTYPERAARVLAAVLDDFDEEELLSYARDAYASFSVPEVTPLCDMKSGVSVLELFHGPTLAFKDMALQLLPRLLNAAARKQNEHREIAILTATSGDTGKAALEGFRDVPGTSCTVFYPLGGVSHVQERQMLTSEGKNVHVIGVHGNFDDAQTGVKKLFTDPQFIKEMDRSGRVLSSANSINLGRLAPQIAYYMSAAAEIMKKGIQRFHVCVPTGNFGNILAAWYAKQMGAPIDLFLCASNSNDVLTEFIASGRYNAAREFRLTVSPSMDILISSNLERLLFELCQRNAVQLTGYMQQLKTEHEYTLQTEMLIRLQKEFRGFSASENETLQVLRDTFEQEHYLMDTHTSVGMAALKKYRAQSGDDTPILLVSTASPFKFAPAVCQALSLPADTDAFDCVRRVSAAANLPVPASLVKLEKAPALHSLTCEKDAMGSAVMTALNG